MLLAIDIGNSESSFGLFSEALVHHWRVSTHPHRTADEYAAFLFPLLHHNDLTWESITGVALCSVVPSADLTVKNFCNAYLKKTPIELNTNVRLGFELKVDSPSEVGADRLANVAFAVKHLPLPSIVVDMGTATTFDVVSEVPAFEGGLILPGLHMLVDSLASNTSKLHSITLEFPTNVLGKNTGDCIKSGILFGYCDMIDGLLDRHDFLRIKSLALTGGLAPLVHERLRHPSRFLPNLTLEGIEILYRMNCLE